MNQATHDSTKFLSISNNFGNQFGKRDEANEWSNQIDEFEQRESG